MTHPPLRTERLYGTSDLARASDRRRDAALLRATTELFVLDTVHTEDEIHRYEELAIHFLPKVSAEDRVFVAQHLAAASDAPPAVLRMLARDTIGIAKPILLHSTGLKGIDLLTIIAGSPIEHHRLIARRAELPPEVVQALSLREDPEILALLGQTPGQPPAAAPRNLDRTAPTPAGIYQSNRLDPWRYLALARPARLHLIADIAANPPASRDDTTSRRLDRAFRSILSAARIVGYARSGQLDAIVESIVEGLDLPAALVSAAIGDKGGELLAVMLKALRLDDAQARQVFLLVSPTGRDVQAFFPLADLYAGMEPSVAETMIEAWRNASTAAKPKYEPVAEPAKERRPAPAARATRDDAAQPEESARRA